jgi:hypothetical protein
VAVQQKTRSAGRVVFITVLLVAILTVLFFTFGYLLARVLI